MSLEEFVGDPHLDISAMMARFTELARENGVAFVPTDMICNTRLAQEVRAWAHEVYGKGQQFERRAFAAYFVEGRNLGQIEVLLDIVQELGLSTDDAGKVMRARTFREPVDRDLAQAENLGIICAPTFIAHGKRLVGAHPLGVLLDFALGREAELGTS